MKNLHLLASDFDGTIALTFDPSPRGLTVDIANRLAFEEMFGEKGLVVYEQIGGMQNREPGELVGEMLIAGDVLNIALRTAGKKLPDLIQEFVDKKLSHLLPEISLEWPTLVPGFRELQASLAPLPVEVGILSSGHDEFIRRVFEVQDLDQPRILVTSDTLRARGVPGRYKPDPFSVEEAVDLFTHFNEGTRPVTTMYIGDSREKDGEMAKRARVPFGLIRPDYPSLNTVDNSSREVTFRDFHGLKNVLFRDPSILQTPRGFEGIFLNGKAPEGQGRGKER